MYKQTSKNNITIINNPVESAKTKSSNEQHHTSNCIKIQKTNCIFVSSSEADNDSNSSKSEEKR